MREVTWIRFDNSARNSVETLLRRLPILQSLPPGEILPEDEPETAQFHGDLHDAVESIGKWCETGRGHLESLLHAPSKYGRVTRFYYSADAEDGHLYLMAMTVTTLENLKEAVDGEMRLWAWRAGEEIYALRYADQHHWQEWEERTRAMMLASEGELRRLGAF